MSVFCGGLLGCGVNKSLTFIYRMYIALDHSPLDFAPFERRDIHTLPMRFGYHLGMHYVSGAIFGAGWVVGSLEILGRLVSERFALCRMEKSV